MCSTNLLAAAAEQAPDSALPIGLSRTVSDTDLVPLDLTLPKAPSELVNRILAIPQAADDASDDEIVDSPVLGFVYWYVTSLNVLRGIEREPGVLMIVMVES